MIVAIEGNQGDGKSATMVYLANHFHKQGKLIHSNFWLDIPDMNFHYVTSLDDINKIYGGYFFADEFWSWIDSRVSGFSKTNEIVTSIIMKLRKRGYSLIYESKRLHMTDRRVRELTDYVLKPHIYVNINGSLKQLKQNFLYPFDLEKILSQLWVVCKIFYIIGNKTYPVPNTSPIIFKLETVINLYDTKEEITGLGDSEPHGGYEKGLKKELHFIEHIKKLNPKLEIYHSPNSRGWDIILDNAPFCFDCVSVFKDKRIHRIDLRTKRIKDLREIAKKLNKKPYFLLKTDDYYCLPMSLKCEKQSTIAASSRNGLVLLSTLILK